MTTSAPDPGLQVSTLIANEQDPVLVDIRTEGPGRLRVELNGSVLYEGRPGDEGRLFER